MQRTKEQAAAHGELGNGGQQVYLAHALVYLAQTMRIPSRVLSKMAGGGGKDGERNNGCRTACRARTQGPVAAQRPPGPGACRGQVVVSRSNGAWGSQQDDH